MSRWSPTNPVSNDVYSDWFLHHDVLVKVHGVGQYQIFKRSDGKLDYEVPHIEILLGGYRDGKKVHYTDVTVRAYSPKPGRQSLIMTIWKSGPQPDSTSPDILINFAKTQLNDAVDLLNNIKARFKAAKARVKEARAFPTIFNTRAEYEAACKKLKVEAIPDALCKSYRIQFGEFKFPEFSGDHCLMMKLARRRFRGIQKAPPPTPKQQSQVWEHCKVCGVEPSYKPLIACEQCWPK